MGIDYNGKQSKNGISFKENDQEIKIDNMQDGNSYLGTFDSLEELKEKYPEKNKKNKRRMTTVGNKCDENSWAIVDDGISSPIQYKFCKSGTWREMGGGSSSVNEFSEIKMIPNKDNETRTKISYDSKQFGEVDFLSLSDGSGFGVEFGSLVSENTFVSNDSRGMSTISMDKTIEKNIGGEPRIPLTGLYTKDFNVSERSDLLLGFGFATNENSKININVINKENSEVILDKLFDLNVKSDELNQLFAIVSPNVNNNVRFNEGSYTIGIEIIEGSLAGDDFPTCLLFYGCMNHDRLVGEKILIEQEMMETSSECFTFSEDGMQLIGFSSDNDKYNCRNITIRQYMNEGSVGSIVENVFTKEVMPWQESVIIKAENINNIHESNFRDLEGNQICRISTNVNSETYLSLLSGGYTVTPIGIPEPQPNTILSSDVNGKISWDNSPIANGIIMMSATNRIRTLSDGFIFEINTYGEWLEVGRMTR